MEDLKRFSLPVKGLSNGIHHYQFELKDNFFQLFESTIIEEGQFNVRVELDKKTAVMNLLIKFEGKISSVCDRCLEPLELELKDDKIVFIKYSDVESEDEDIVYITHSTSEINIAHILYEYIVLSVPVNRVYHTDESKCRKSDLIKDEDSVQNSDDIDENGRWDILKGLDFKE